MTEHIMTEVLARTGSGPLLKQGGKGIACVEFACTAKNRARGHESFYVSVPQAALDQCGGNPENIAHIAFSLVAGGSTEAPVGNISDLNFFDADGDSLGSAQFGSVSPDVPRSNASEPGAMAASKTGLFRRALKEIGSRAASWSGLGL